jgi:hypothetical protein
VIAVSREAVRGFPAEISTGDDDIGGQLWNKRGLLTFVTHLWSRRVRPPECRTLKNIGDVPQAASLWLRTRQTQPNGWPSWKWRRLGFTWRNKPRGTATPISFTRRRNAPQLGRSSRLKFNNPMPVDPESEAELLRSRELIEAARREREQLLEQIQESEKTIAKSRELISRIDEMLARLGK